MGLTHFNIIADNQMTVPMEDNVGTLEDNAVKRKERLAALKRKLGQGRNGDAAAAGGEEDSLPTPVFRSYRPAAPELADNALEPAEPAAIDEQIQVVIGLSYRGSN